MPKTTRKAEIRRGASGSEVCFSGTRQTRRCFPCRKFASFSALGRSVGSVNSPEKSAPATTSPGSHEYSDSEPQSPLSSPSKVCTHINRESGYYSSSESVGSPSQNSPTRISACQAPLSPSQFRSLEPQVPEEQVERSVNSASYFPRASSPELQSESSVSSSPQRPTNGSVSTISTTRSPERRSASVRPLSPTKFWSRQLLK